MDEQTGTMTVQDALIATRGILGGITLPAMPAAMCAVMAQAVTVPISQALVNLDCILEAMDSADKARAADAPAENKGE